MMIDVQHALCRCGHSHLCPINPDQESTTSVHQWLEERTTPVTTLDGWTNSSTLYQDYLHWCRRSSTPPWGQRRFKAVLQGAGVMYKKDSVIKGSLALRPEDLPTP